MRATLNNQVGTRPSLGTRQVTTLKSAPPQHTQGDLAIAIAPTASPHFYTHTHVYSQATNQSAKPLCHVGRCRRLGKHHEDKRVVDAKLMRESIKKRSQGLVGSPLLTPTCPPIILLSQAMGKGPVCVTSCVPLQLPTVLVWGLRGKAHTRCPLRNACCGV